MTRFTIYQDYLYTVDYSDMRLFNISTPSSPAKTAEIPLGWDIETIFPYQDKLFIGSRSGMHIYDNVTPSSPQYLSTFEHARSCDPVVVEGNYAYVTLRSGTECEGFNNQLDVIDIENLTHPSLVKTYPMINPHGLGIDQGTLFICEGQDGLKVLNASDPANVIEQKHFKNMHAFDVIPLGKVLLMIGEDGLYQYDYTNPDDLKLLSTIPVEQL